MNYSDLLKDVRWQKKRLEVLNRDNFTCKECEKSDKSGEYVSLHVHHSFYEKGFKPWDYPLESLKTLCSDCHEKEGDKVKRYSYELIQAIKKAGAVAGNFAQLVCVFREMSGRDDLTEMLIACCELPENKYLIQAIRFAQQYQEQSAREYFDCYLKIALMKPISRKGLLEVLSEKNLSEFEQAEAFGETIQQFRDANESLDDLISIEKEFEETEKESEETPLQ